MKAVVFSGASEPIEIQDVDLAPPGPGEVRVKVAAAGVCHSDLHIRRGEWEIPTPLVMGHEGSGTVMELGAGVSSLTVGDHVVLSWVPSCGKCRHCLAGREARCQVAATTVALEGFLLDGTSRLSRNGHIIHHYLGVSSFAEEVVVPESGAIKIRDDAPLETMALVGCAVATGVGAVMNTARVESGSTVVVIGCGGVGLSVVQGARLAGADRIVAIDLRPEKTALALTMGATDELIVDSANPVEALRSLITDGADYVFDAIGMTKTTEQAIEMLSLGGAAVIVGLAPSGARASFEPLNLAVSDQRILGSNYGSVRPAIDLPKLVDLYMSGDLLLDQLVSDRRSLDQAVRSLDDLQSGNALRTLLIP